MRRPDFQLCQITFCSPLRDYVFIGRQIYDIVASLVLSGVHELHTCSCWCRQLLIRIFQKNLGYFCNYKRIRWLLVHLAQKLFFKVDLCHQVGASYRSIFLKYTHKMWCYCTGDKYERFLINSQGFTKNRCALRATRASNTCRITIVHSW